LSGGQLADLKDSEDFKLVLQMILKDRFMSSVANVHYTISYTGLHYDNRSRGETGTFPDTGFVWLDGSPLDMTSTLPTWTNIYTWTDPFYPGDVAIGPTAMLYLSTECEYNTYYFAICQIPGTQMLCFLC
jgi:hypothetical protein